MNDINKVIFTGRLTREPELRSTANGTEVLNIGMAVNDSRRNAKGEWEDHANFVDCKMFGNRAAKVAPMLSKGMKATIEGKLSYSAWKGDDGRNRSKLEVLVDNIDFQLQRDAQPGGDYAADDLPF